MQVVFVNKLCGIGVFKFRASDVAHIDMNEGICICDNKKRRQFFLIDIAAPVKAYTCLMAITACDRKVNAILQKMI